MNVALRVDKLWRLEAYDSVRVSWLPPPELNDRRGDADHHYWGSGVTRLQ
jgi:hypothetical protein